MKILQPDDDNVQHGSAKCDTEDNSENAEVEMNVGVKSGFDLTTEAGTGKIGKALSCKFCSQMFRNIGIQHENGHTQGNKDGNATLTLFPCKVCKKEFSEKGMLNLHMRTHTCGHCGKHFYNTSNMKRHINEKHSKEEFSCDLCKNKFKNERYMRDHIVRVHQMSDAAEVLK